MSTKTFLLVSENHPSIPGSMNDEGGVVLSTGETFERFELFREYLKTKQPKYMVEDIE